MIKRTLLRAFLIGLILFVAWRYLGAIIYAIQAWLASMFWWMFP